MSIFNAIPTIDHATAERGVLPIAAYAACVDCIAECDIWGVTDQPNCMSNWSVQQRNGLLGYLRKANQQLADWMGWYPVPQWIKGERVEIGKPIFLKYGHLLDIGCPMTDVIATGVELTWNDDKTMACFSIYVNDTIDVNDPTQTVPGIPALANVTDECEIELCHVGSTITIVPESVTWNAETGQLDVCIPRCRLVKPSVYAAQNKVKYSGIYCLDDDKFASTVDVKRTYTDKSDVGRIVCSSYSCCGGCTERIGEFCVQILNRETGELIIHRTDNKCCCDCCMEHCYAEINYFAGGPFDPTLCAMLTGTAHAIMPTSPCEKCTLLEKKWTEDKAYYGDIYKKACARRLVRMVLL